MIKWGPWIDAEDEWPVVGDYIQAHGTEAGSARPAKSQGFVTRVDDGGFEIKDDLDDLEFEVCHWRRARLPDEDKKVIREREMEECD